MVLNDNFPASTSVLAIDSDPVSLTHTESLLRNSQYHVTIANKATEALELLKNNKNKFNLILTEVDFPDMDVFKLLQYVADVPFIILSSNGNKELIMKCNAHGACDYLLKPIKIEVVKNIWQYVDRKMKSDSRERKNVDYSREVFKETENFDVCPKSYKKRKDRNTLQNVNHQENYELNRSTQNKHRLVWTEELHGKFTRAVDQLGLDNAVPKRILELMNDEKVTRENVASHLQKYRLYMKKKKKMNERALANSDSDYKSTTSDNIRNMGSTGFSSYPVVSSDLKTIPWNVMNTQTRIQNRLHRMAFTQSDITPQISKTSSVSSSSTNYNYNNNVGNLNVKVNQYSRRNHNESSFVENSYMDLPYIQTDIFWYQKHQITPVAGCNMMNHSIRKKSSIFPQEFSSPQYSFGHDGNSLVVPHEVNNKPEWLFNIDDLDVYLNDSDEHTNTSS